MESTSKADIIKAMKACDEETLVIKRRADNIAIGSLLLIYNNGEISPISDMTARTNEELDQLSDLIEPIDEYAESLED